MKRYFVTTFGCQMNAHDSERIKGMLESLGLGEAVSQDEADVVVFNTCTIREKPDQRLAAHLAQAKALKDRDPERVIAVGGCYAEAQRERIFERYPFVDVAFGPGLDPAPRRLARRRRARRPRSAFGTGSERRFSGELPLHRERPFQAWVQISMGCNSKCAYCIVPAVRGREASRRPGRDRRRGRRGSRAEGVREVTLLGQNVNSYGRDLPPDTRVGFAELLRAFDAIDGIERIRFTSPHPKDFRPDVIAAMAECAAVCEHAHLPLQSGSTADPEGDAPHVLARALPARSSASMRAAIPDLALTTDLIVGFPGETEDDFRETVEVVEEVGFDGAFTFVFSPRSGTEAAAMPDQVPEEVKRERIERLIEVVQRVGGRAGTPSASGGVEEVLVEGPSRTDPALLRGRHAAQHDRELHRHGGRGRARPRRIDGATSTTLRGAQAVLAAA